MTYLRTQETNQFYSQHDHTIPGIDLPDGPLLDYSDQGYLWDPTLNAYSYTYDVSTGAFTAADDNTPVAWLNFNGKWGDDQPEDEKEIFGQAEFVAGPNGPKFKSLNRTEVCPSSPCVVWDAIVLAGNETSI